MIGEALKGAAEKVTAPVTRRIILARTTSEAMLATVRDMGNAARQRLVDRVSISTQATISTVIDGVASGSKKAVNTVIDGLALGSKAVANSAVTKLAMPAAAQVEGTAAIPAVVSHIAGGTGEAINGVLNRLQAGSVRNDVTAEARTHVVFGFFNIHIHMK